jgi:hypothetical protein
LDILASGEIGYLRASLFACGWNSDKLCRGWFDKVDAKLEQLSMSGDGSIEHSLLGECAEYPGHPAVIAACIIEKYASFEEATAKNSGGDPNSLGDDDIPGGGGAGYAALDFLKHVKLKGFESAFVWAQSYWSGLCFSIKSKEEKTKKGFAQAEKVKPFLEERLKTWPL